MQDPSLFAQLKFPEQELLKCPRCDSLNTKFCYYNNYNLSQPRHFCKNCRRYWTKGGALRNIPVGGGTRKSTKRSSSSTNIKNRSSSSSPSSNSNSAVSSPSPTPSVPVPVSASINCSSASVTVSDSITHNMNLKPDIVSFLGSSKSSPASTSTPSTAAMSAEAVMDPNTTMMNHVLSGAGGDEGKFSSTLRSNGQFGNLYLGGFNPSGPNSSPGGVKLGSFTGSSQSLNPGPSSSGLTLNPSLGLQICSSNSGIADGGFLTSTGLQNSETNFWGDSNNGSNGWPDLAI